MTTPLHEKEYTLFCDESDRRGRFFSNFYGGVRVPASSLLEVEHTLASCKARLGLNSEIKWEKVGPGIVERYETFITVFFDQLAARRAVMRVMFTQNARVPVGLSNEQLSESYYLLYYQFLKHGFGLTLMPPHATPPRVRIYLDEIGDTREQISRFRGYLAGLASNKSIRAAGGIILEEAAITEVRSHDHIIMQALDVVLGSATFRLNNKHLDRAAGQIGPGKRTVAKERLYKHILSEIKRVTGKAGFNVGISTGATYPGGRWHDPYLHWLFVPAQHRFDDSFTKP
jgi:hypothetical protein